MTDAELAKFITMLYYTVVWIAGVVLGMAAMWWIVKTTPDLIETKELTQLTKQQ